jgi:outer membrane lipoprotein carrier protein
MADTRAMPAVRPGDPTLDMRHGANSSIFRGKLSLTVALLLGTLAAAQSRPAQPVATPDARPPASDVAAALQRKYDAIKDFSASFIQTYEGGVLRRKASESGTVYVKKPGRMRWDYTSPEKKLFISDGRTMFLYFPADKQVMKNPVPDQDEATSTVLFLMGKGDIVRDFNVKWAEGGTENTYRLRLDPKTRQAEYDWLEVAADRHTLQIVGLTAADAQGGRSSFSFSNFKENVGLADKMFQFSIPRGTEVISSGKTP